VPEVVGGPDVQRLEARAGIQTGLGAITCSLG
jgi:hypothetical protein